MFNFGEFLPGAVVLRSWALTGGVSATVTAVEFRLGGKVERAVVREYGARDLARNADVAGAEFRLLSALHEAGLPVPKPLYHAPGVLVIEFIEGKSGVDYVPDSHGLAHFLAQLHALPTASLELPTLPNVSLPEHPLVGDHGQELS